MTGLAPTGPATACGSLWLVRAPGILSALLLLVATACQFDAPLDQADAAVDAPPPECEANTRSCTGDLYTECGPDGRFVRHDVPNGGPAGEPVTLVMDDYACPLGCHATEPRCADISASNGLDSAFDDPAVSPTGIDLVVDDPTGPASIFDTHEPSSRFVTLTFSNGTSIALPAVVIPQTDGPDLRIIMLRSLTVRGGSILKLRGAKPIAIASHFDVSIGGLVDYSGNNNTNTAVEVGCDLANITSAVGGAGNSTSGGRSSTGGAGGNAQTRNPNLTPLTGGCSSLGGIGGGGLQLASRRRIMLAATGRISVAGGPGKVLTPSGGFYAFGGGGGGNLVLESPMLGLVPGALIIGRGGSGSAGNPATGTTADGVPGDGSPTGATVPGGVCPDCDARGGAGGTEASLPGAGTSIGTGLAGGGGAVGRVILRLGALVVPAPGSLKIDLVRVELLPSR